MELCKLVRRFSDKFPLKNFKSDRLNHLFVNDVMVPADNEKALYRRAKAHIGAWNPDLAEEDFLRLKTLNPTMGPTVDKELAQLRKLQKEKQSRDKDALIKMFGTDNGT